MTTKIGFGSFEHLRSENPGGDIGPCDHINCHERAVWKALVELAGGVRTFVYVCDDHEFNNYAQPDSQ